MLIISIDEFGPGFPAMPVTTKSNSIYIPIENNKPSFLSYCGWISLTTSASICQQNLNLEVPPN